MNRFLLSVLLLVLCLTSYGGSSNTKYAKVGDIITVNTSYHYYTQSVLWTWDYSVLELQGKLYGTSTSASFKVIKAIPSSGSVIQAVTYYYQSGTTSSGINKDVDDWKVYPSGGGDGGGGDNPGTDKRCVTVKPLEATLAVGEYVDLTATVYNGSATKFSWSSSNPSVATFSTMGDQYCRVFANAIGDATIRVAIDNGSYAECAITVKDKHLEFTLNSDNASYSVQQNSDNKPSGRLEIPRTYKNLPVTEISFGGFSNCNLTSVSLPSSLTAIGAQAFYRCSNLTSVSLPSSLTTIGGSAFRSCNSLTSINLPSSITTIGEYAFYSCDNLTSVSLPSSLTTIGSCAFGYSALTTITIPASVTTIGSSPFVSCSELYEIKVDQANKAYTAKDGVLYTKDMRQLIQYPIGNSRTSFIIPASVTTIGDYSFQGCSGLTSITIPASVTTIGDYAFYHCSGLTSISLPSALITIESYAFSHCYGLTSITIPASVTTIRYSSFASCSNLTEIKVDEGNKAYTAKDGVLYSKDMQQLIQYPIGNSRASFIIPASVTTIGTKAFMECSGLTSITIPASVTIIGPWAFRWCDNIMEIYCQAETPPTCDGSFTTNEATLYVPIGSKNKYQNSDWKIFEKIIETDFSNINDDNGNGDDDGLLTFTKATRFEAGEYAIVANGKAATCLPDKAYGYFPGTSVTVADNKVKAPAECVFTFTQAPGGYYIQDSENRYLFMRGTFNSYNFAGNLGDTENSALWTVSIAANGEATVTNVAKSKVMQWSVQYSSYGAYSEITNVLPVLYKKATSAVSVIDTDSSDLPVEIYNLNGVCLGNPDNLPAGIYLRRQGSKVSKIFVK